MKVTKSQIINGVIEYAKSEMIDKITDKPLKMILATGISAIELNNSIVDGLFENPIVSGILGESDGKYELDDISEILFKTLDEYGDFPIIIPAIKFISPYEKELKFTSSDVRKLKEYIGGVD